MLLTNDSPWTTIPREEFWQCPLKAEKPISHKKFDVQEGSKSLWDAGSAKKLTAQF